MSDAELSAKFALQAEDVLPAGRVQHLIELCWRLEELADVGEVAHAAASL